MRVGNQKIDFSKVSRWHAVDSPWVAVRKLMNMTHYDTKSISLNFGVQSLFDSKISKLKELTKIFGGKVWSDHPYMVGNWGIKNTKSIMHQTWHAVSEWQPDVKTERTYQNFRGQSVVRPPQTDNYCLPSY